jgi:hypothetical protein
VPGGGRMWRLLLHTTPALFPTRPVWVTMKGAAAETGGSGCEWDC